MSRFQRLLAYLATKRGRDAVCIGVTTFGIGLVATRWATHSIGLNYYREFVASYDMGIERQLAKRVKDRFEKALDMVKDLDELERSRYKLFCVSGIDPFHAGSYHSVFGSIIGIPVNFEFRNKFDIPHNQMTAGTKPVNWDTEAGEVLEKALILTEDEQIFAMLKEILSCRTWQWPLNCVYSFIWVFSTYGMAMAFNNKLNLRQRPLSLRFVMYTLVTLFNLGVYCLLTDSTQLYYETEIDKELAAMGKDMVDAGHRYYDKVLARNRAYRALSGDVSTYSATGNHNMFLRQRCMPFTKRKEFFYEQLKKLQENQESFVETS